MKDNKGLIAGALITTCVGACMGYAVGFLNGLLIKVVYVSAENKSKELEKKAS